VGFIPDSPLGRPARYPEAYDPALLFAVDRSPQRLALGVGDALPFAGADHWTAWEATWRDGSGRPRVGVVTFDVPCTSPRLVESKSVKLWLASLANERFATPAACADVLAADLRRATGADVDVRVHPPDAWPGVLARAEPPGDVIDDDVPADPPEAPDPALLRQRAGRVEETLRLRSFRSVCPVTAQPDHADVLVSYRGRPLDRSSLAAYLAAFRRHPGFHEHCVEQIFVHVLSACAPDALRVEARFTRRGGIDINPVRARGMSAGSSPPTLRQ
jgi:7-cyano-7-deazaguanine reductase